MTIRTHLIKDMSGNTRVLFTIIVKTEAVLSLDGKEARAVNVGVAKSVYPDLFEDCN